MNVRVLILLLVLVSLATPALSWWCMGHMLVAAIGQKFLQKIKPDSFETINKLISIQAQYSPLSPDFVTAACWADDVKATSRLEAGWHFINLPIIGDSPPIQAIPSNTKYDYTIVWALDTINGTLAAHDTRTSILEQARLLYWLIHFVGDVHQPLHASTLYSATHEGPVGDMGGNLYKIKSYKGMNNLHSFWDSAAGVFPTNPRRPLSPADADNISAWADKIMHEYPFEMFQKEMMTDTFSGWSKESWQISRDLAYKTPEFAELTQDYVDAAQDMCMQRLALGGYRLGWTLAQLFGRSNFTTGGDFTSEQKASFRNLL